MLVDNINVDLLQSNVAVVTFADTARVEFRLDAFDTRTDIKNAIDDIPYSRGTTNTAEALRLVREEVFVPNRGDREQLPNIVILFTDGGSNNFERALQEARLSREEGIVLISVGISNWINMIELREIASDPDEFNVFNIESFDLITRIRSDLKAILCDRECAA